MTAAPGRGGTRALSRLYRRLLRAFPAEFRSHDADAMSAVYDELEADARYRSGWRGSVAVFVSELPGLLDLFVREHHAARRDRIARRAERRRAGAVAASQRPFTEDKSMIESLLQDVRYAARALRKSPAFTAICVATLALGVGANTAIFSVVNGVLLQPLPFHRPDRIVTVMARPVDGDPGTYGSSPANFIDLRRDAQAASHFAAFSTRLVTLIGPDEPVSLRAVLTVGDLFGALGVRPLFGRALSPSDDDPAAPAVVVLGYSTWQQFFGEDRGILGRTITINRRPRTVVGVMPPDFHFSPAPADLWIPEQWPVEYAGNRDQYYLQIVARLADGQSMERLSAQLEAVAARLRADHGEYNTDLHLFATSLQETVVSDVRTRLLVLMGAVGFLLLITCANLANLMLARGSARESEFAVRRALGAGRGRVVRQLLTESLLLAIAGGAVGIVVGTGLLEVIVAAQRTSLPRVDEIGLDATTLAFATVVSLVAGVVFGVLPALRISTTGSMAALRRGTRAGASHQGARSALVVAELAIALVLLTGAGLLLRSFTRLVAVDAGFRTEKLLTMQLGVGNRATETVEASLERIRAIPGVHSASVVSQLPVTGRGVGAWFNIIGRPVPPNETPPAVPYRVISPEYFATIGVRLLSGRMPTLDDRADRAPAVVINEALARRFWPNENPLGREVQLGAPGNYLMPPSRIVGVVADTRDAGLDADPIPAVYLPMRVAPWWTVYTYVIRASTTPEAVVPAVRRELRALFPTTAIRNVQTMDTVLRDTLAPARLSTRLIGAFALVALITGALGVFGVLSFAVAQRTRELGIRMALGAAPADVRRMVIAYGARLALAGVAIGLVGSFVLTRLISSMLFNVAPTDPLTFVSVSAILLAIGVLASWLPARRATRIDPIVALRAD